MKKDHIEIFIVFVSLVVSVISLNISLNADKSNKYPNIFVESVEGSRFHEKNGPIDSLNIRCKIVLKNIGRGSTQIINVLYEPILTNSEMKYSNESFSISDVYDLRLGRLLEYYQSIKNNPILGIKNTFIQGEETKTLYVRYTSSVKLSKGNNIPNVRITVLLAHGVELKILPQIKTYGYQSSWN